MTKKQQKKVGHPEADFDNYQKFVMSITSKESSDNEAFLERLAALKDEGCETNRLLTAAVGMSAEAGEFTEIVKKMIFQGKPYNDDNKKHLLIELGDVMWYVAQACMALNIDMNEVLDINIKKLSKRYPEGTFDAYFSENRAANDR